MKLILFFALIFSSSAFAQGDTPFGRPADPKKAQRMVRVEMTDQMRFSPVEIAVQRGETIRFEVINKGKLEHELVLGTLAGLKQHLEHMKQHAGAAHEEGDKRNEVEVAPGKRGIIGWQFTKAGEFYYGCLVPGHFEAGMIGKVLVK